MTNKKILSTQEIRALFLDFFTSKKHKVIESSSLVPHDDPSLLFTTSTKYPELNPTEVGRVIVT